MKNRYFYNSKLTEAQFLELLDYFAQDISASSAARLSGVAYSSVKSIYGQIRHRLAESQSMGELISGDVVFLRLAEKDGTVFVVGGTDACAAAAVNIATFEYQRLQQSPLCESFWGKLKARLLRYPGIRRATLSGHVADALFRFNHRRDVYSAIEVLLRTEPLGNRRR